MSRNDIKKPDITEPQRTGDRRKNYPDIYDAPVPDVQSLDQDKK